MHSHAVQIMHLGTGLGAGAPCTPWRRIPNYAIISSRKFSGTTVQNKKQQPLSFQKPEASFCGSRNFQILLIFYAKKTKICWGAKDYFEFFIWKKFLWCPLTTEYSIKVASLQLCENQIILGRGLCKIVGGLSKIRNWCTFCIKLQKFHISPQILCQCFRKKSKKI